MTRDDHAALMAIGRHMAATNGYRPEQASDLYISSGTTRDYEYGMYRIFSYTFEMSVVDYPDDSLINAETGSQQGGRPLPDRTGVVPTRGPGSGDPDRPLRRVRRRPRGEPRLGPQPRRDGHGDGVAPGRAAPRSGPTTAAGVKQPGSVTSGRFGFVDRAGRGDVGGSE